MKIQVSENQFGQRGIEKGIFPSQSALAVFTKTNLRGIEKGIFPSQSALAVFTKTNFILIYHKF